MEERIPLFPLHTLLFPQTDLGLHVFEERYRTLVARCLDNGESFGIALIRRGSEVGGPAECHDVGTLARIAGYARLPDGRYLLEVEGVKRFRIEDADTTGPYPEACVSWLSEPIGNFAEARGESLEAESLLLTYRMQNGDGDTPIHLPVDPVARSYVVASLLNVDPPAKQALLEAESADLRLSREVAILRRELDLLEHPRSERR